MSGGGVASHDALALALAFFKAPGRFPDLLHGRAPLPAGMTELLQVAAGDLPEGATPPMFVSVPELQKAALFFIEQVLLARDADHYRVMGLAPGAGGEQIKEHHRLLMRLFHPDRRAEADEQAEAAAARINRGYAVLRGAETRAAYFETVQPTAATAAPGVTAYARPVVRVASQRPERVLPPAFRRNAPQIVLGAVAVVAIAAVALVYVNRVPDGAIGAGALAEAPRGAAVAAVKSDDVVDPPGRVETGGRLESRSLVESGGRVEPSAQAEASSGAESGGRVESSVRLESSSRVESSARVAASGGVESGGRVAPARRFELPSGVEVTSAPRPPIVPRPAPSREGQAAPQPRAEASLEAAATAAPKASPMPAPAQEAAPAPLQTAARAVPDVAPASVQMATRGEPPTPVNTVATSAPRSGESVHAASPQEVARAAAPVPAPAAAVVASAPQVSEPARETPAEPPAAVLQRFVAAYERGDLEALMALFDADARIERGGRARIRSDYDALFRGSEMRSLRLRDLRWSGDGEVTRAEGAFVVRVLRRGEEAMREVGGSIRVELVKRGDRLLIIGLYHTAG